MCVKKSYYKHLYIFLVNQRAFVVGRGKGRNPHIYVRKHLRCFRLLPCPLHGTGTYAETPKPRNHPTHLPRHVSCHVNTTSVQSGLQSESAGPRRVSDRRGGRRWSDVAFLQSQVILEGWRPSLLGQNTIPSRLETPSLGPTSGMDSRICWRNRDQYVTSPPEGIEPKHPPTAGDPTVGGLAPSQVLDISRP